MIVSSLLGGCCHLGGDDDAEGYDPCEDKQEGETCQLCPPDDPDCVETQEVKVCDAEGTCGGTEASTHAH
ncbi:MAG: hypothetical protein JNL21_36910 [Myxococcales bacterium]|nr:hypothetical protein [Myxococcales bacterium]